MLSVAAPAAVCLFVSGMVQAAFCDLTTMTIQNRLVLALLAVYIALAPLVGFSLNDIILSAAVALAVLVVTFFLFTRGWIGGGDAKLASVTVLWLGADHTLAYLVYTALIGGVLTVGLVYFRHWTSLPSMYASVPWIERLHSPESGVPYGIAMAPAALIVFASTRWTALAF